METESNDTCVSPFVGRLDPGWKIYHIVYNVVFVVVVLVVTGTWMWLRIKRKMKTLLLGYVFSVGASALPYLLFKAVFIIDVESKLTSCPARGFALIWQLFLVLPFVGITVLANNKIKYNKAMVAYFSDNRSIYDPISFTEGSTAIKGSSRQGTVSVIESLNVLKHNCSGTYLNMWYLAAYSITGPLVIFVSFLICSFDCEILDAEFGRPSFVGTVIGVIFITLYTSTKKKMEQLIDRIGYLGTADMLIKYVVLPLFVFNVLDLSDALTFKFYEQAKIGFSFNIGTDYSILGYYIILSTDALWKQVNREAMPPATLSLDQVLATPAIAEMFQEFLQVSFCVENLIFWRAVESYKRSSKSSRQMAREIFAHFVRAGAEAQVNLSHEIKERIGKRISNGDVTVDLFDEALEEIDNLMEYDLLPRFMASDYYKMLLSEATTESL